MPQIPVTRTRLLACGWLVLLAACAPSDHELLADARSALAGSAYADAVAAADSGLARGADPRVAWGLELVKLEAHARAGEAEPTVEQLAKLTRLHPDRIPPTQYSATADQLRTAGQGSAAIQVLDMGLKRFPENATLARLIGDAGSGDVDPAEIEMLKSLGYL